MCGLSLQRLRVQDGCRRLIREPAVDESPKWVVVRREHAARERLHTQTELANGEKREGFEIRVHDAQADSEKEFAVMSGGQKVWINECLTRGIALYRAQGTGTAFQTLFTDEADGPLDPERKREFMKMKREVLRQGGYEREYFISQTPDLVDEADAVIDVVALATQ